MLGKCGHSIHRDIQFLRLLPNARAVISTKGFCRIVQQPQGKTVWEFVDREFAHRMVAQYELDKEERGYWYEAIDYETGKVLNFDCRGLSMDFMERVYQVDDYFPEGQDTVKRYRKTYHRAKGFKLGRLLPGPAKRKAASPVKLFKPAKPERRKFRSAS